MISYMILADLIIILITSVKLYILNTNLVYGLEALGGVGEFTLFGGILILEVILLVILICIKLFKG